MQRDPMDEYRNVKISQDGSTVQGDLVTQQGTYHFKVERKNMEQRRRSRGRCPKGKHWVKGHWQKKPDGKGRMYVKGHCAEDP